MSAVDELRQRLEQCSTEERKAVFDYLRETIPIHPFEVTMNAKAEVIMEAMARASDLSLRGIRGLIGEATFAVEIAPHLEGWRDVTPPGNHAYDVALADAVSTARVQVKMQRRKEHVAWLRGGVGVVEVQRTRGGERAGEDTRPYHFGGFDILAVCMEPSHRKWDSFLYIPERWLISRPGDNNLIDKLQPVPLQPDAIWTDDFHEVVRRLRSGVARPI